MFSPSQIIALPELAIEGSDRFPVMQVFQGGMGVCAKISHVETGELLALKMMRPELTAGARARARFEIEALAWVELSNIPGVVPALDVARWNDIAFVAAARMEGGDLSTQMHRVNAELYFAVAFRVASALDAANRMHGIIHGDIKASNILLDRDARPFVTDWGLAKMHRQDSPRPLLTGLDAGPRTGLTVAGTFLGTLTYAAPEQILDAASADWRADLYSLGCVLYENGNRTPHEIARQHLTNMPPTLPGGGRFDTADIVLHCLEKPPASRHDSYGTLLELLEHAAARFGIEPPSRTASTPPTQQRISSGAYAVISEEEWHAELSKATTHVAFGRYREAHHILARYFVPELLTDAEEWHFGHSLALNFACCLTNVDGDQLRISADADPSVYALALTRTRTNR